MEPIIEDYEWEALLKNIDDSVKEDLKMLSDCIGWLYPRIIQDKINKGVSLVFRFEGGERTTQLFKEMQDAIRPNNKQGDINDSRKL